MFSVRITSSTLFYLGSIIEGDKYPRLRGSPHADTEIRMLAVEVCRALKKESPNIFHDIEIYDEADGMPAVRVTHSKV